MTNVDYLDRLSRNLLQDINPKRAADIGAADGDISFFLEQEGWEMTIVDNPPTNWNSLRGAKLYKEQPTPASKSSGWTSTRSSPSKIDTSWSSSWAFFTT